MILGWGPQRRIVYIFTKPAISNIEAHRTPILTDLKNEQVGDVLKRRLYVLVDLFRRHVGRKPIAAPFWKVKISSTLPGRDWRTRWSVRAWLATEPGVAMRRMYGFSFISALPLVYVIRACEYRPACRTVGS